MEKDFCTLFEQNVFSQVTALLGCQNFVENIRIGAAVSGGADSISLLVSLWNLCKKNKNPLYVISVNHNIRPEAETGGDAEYVRFICSQLQMESSEAKIYFNLVELKRGAVFESAEDRKGGIEEAARFLRYQAFENFIENNQLDCLCLAHNADDFYETLLMRFLQGSGLEGSCGIAAKRGKFLRPLLKTARKDIEKYLTLKGIKWRTDSTNLDTQYLRNKIRLELVPFLNKNFNFWQSALSGGAEKASLDCDFITGQVQNAREAFDKDFINLEEFRNLHGAIQKRVLVSRINQCVNTGRISSGFLNDILCLIRDKKDFSKIYEDLEISSLNNKLFIKKTGKKQTDLVFFDIIDKEGVYDFPAGLFSVSLVEKNCVEIKSSDYSVQVNIRMPFCIRNWQPEDVIKTNDGSYRKVADVFSSWHVDVSSRCFIPVIQELDSEKQDILCIFGKPLGFYNWVVNEKVID